MFLTVCSECLILTNAVTDYIELKKTATDFQSKQQLHCILECLSAKKNLKHYILGLSLLDGFSSRVQTQEFQKTGHVKVFPFKAFSSEQNTIQFIPFH